MKIKRVIVCSALFYLTACGGTEDQNTSSSSSSSSSSSGEPLPSEFNLSEAQIQKSVFCPADNDEEGPTDWPTALDTQTWESRLSGLLAAEVHGSIPSGGITVFNVGGDYISAYTRDPDLAETFKTLKRYDRVDISANYTITGSAQPHINVTELGFSSKAESTYEHNFDYQRFDGLDNVKLLGSVHAVAGSGEVLVFNYENIVIPIFVDDAFQEKARTLWKFDKVLLDLSVEPRPGRPLHFYTNINSDNPIRIVDAVKDCDGKTADLVGNLINLNNADNNFFGVEVFDENKAYRSYLVISNASLLTDIWNQHLDKVVDGKGGKTTIPDFKVKVNANMISVPGAAHLFISGVNSIEVLSE